MRCEYEVVSDEPGYPLVVRDVGYRTGTSVTNDAEALVQHLLNSSKLANGRELWYFDSDGQLDWIQYRAGLGNAVYGVWFLPLQNRVFASPVLNALYERLKEDEMSRNDNLPPGVRVTDIPGSRPEDEAWERFHEQVDEECSERGIDPEEALQMWHVGLSVVSAWRWLHDD